MKAVYFPEYNIVYGENQPQYNPLPACQVQDPNGTIVSCWELSDEELELLKQTKRIFISVLTFDQPPQPILPMVQTPFLNNN